MLDFLQITEVALAQAANAKQPSIWESLVIPLGGFFLIMYFIVIRPQQKKAREAADMLANLKNGDEVVTSSGIIGRVKSIADSFVTLEISGNTNIKILKTHIAGLTKPKDKETPAKA